MTLRQKGTTKSNGRKHTLDKFYTKKSVAKLCIDSINLNEYTDIIEPSAGSGSFSNQINGCIAYDLYPESSSVMNADWFKHIQARDSKKKVLIIGNPPFGQQNSLAIRFMNYSAKFADTIAFILPKSFMKESIHNSLDKNLHLRKNLILPKNSFDLNGKDIDIPCVFQVWDFNSQKKRITVESPLYKGFDFVKKENSPDLFIQRIGGKAGIAGLDWQNRSIQSNYFIKIDSRIITAEEFVTAVNNTNFPARDYSVGPRSISKKELVSALISTHVKFSA